MFLLFGTNEQERLKIMSAMNMILSKKLKESRKCWGDPHDYSKEFLSDNFERTQSFYTIPWFFSQQLSMVTENELKECKSSWTWISTNFGKIVTNLVSVCQVSFSTYLFLTALLSTMQHCSTQCLSVRHRMLLIFLADFQQQESRSHSLVSVTKLGFLYGK